ncbi:hypothetical protein [Gimesia chilikensis]|uniref:hypothetical protein n=1 Tax=Gimesia chilikensis TaxID=2605989 RepID=UPI003A946203
MGYKLDFVTVGSILLAGLLTAPSAIEQLPGSADLSGLLKLTAGGLYLVLFFLTVAVILSSIAFFIHWLFHS